MQCGLRPRLRRDRADLPRGEDGIDPIEGCAIDALSHVNRSRFRDTLVILGLVSAVLVIYGQTGGYDFISYDDRSYVTNNAAIRNGVTWESLRWAFTSTDGSNWHPLTWVSYMADYRFFGLHPRGYHLVNVVLHAANTVLVFWVLRTMTGAMWPGAFVAALFGVHPLHVESVAWVAERKDVLSTLCWLLTMWAYARYAEYKRLGWYLAALGLFALGLMAKPMLVTLPFVLLLLDWWPLRRGVFSSGEPPREPLGRLVLEKVPFMALAAASSALTFIAQSSGGAVATLERFPLDVRLMNAVVSYVAYLQKTVWPVGLSVHYPHPGSALSAWRVLAAAIILLAVTAAAIRWWRSRPCVAVGWLWYLGMLVPVIGLVQVGDQAMADRYTYVPLIGVFIAVAWGARDLAARWRRARWAMPWLATVVVMVFTVAAWNQARYWRDSLTLYEHAVSVVEGDPLLHYNLANELRERGRFAEAARHYEDAVRFDPNHAAAHTNLGPILAQQGRFDDAIAHYTAALRINPDLAEAHNNLGMLLAEQGNIEEAIPHFQEAVRIKPEMEAARRNLDVAQRAVKDE